MAKESQEALRRGRELVKKNQDERAAAEFSRALQMTLLENKGVSFDRTLLAVPFHERGMCFYRMKQYPQALADFQSLVGLIPNRSLPYFRRGSAYFALGQYEKALADFKIVSDSNPKDGQVLGMMATTLAYLKREDEALQTARQAEAILPDLRTQMLLGRLYERKGKPQAASEWYSLVIEKNAGEMYAYARRGICYQKMGKKEEAKKDIEKAKALGLKMGPKTKKTKTAGATKGAGGKNT